MLVGAGLASLIWRETEASDKVRDTILRVVQDMEAVVVVGAIMAYAVVEGGTMLAEKYLQKRYEEGKEEGKEEGFEQALRILEQLQAQYPNGSDLAEELRRGLKRESETNR